MKLLKFLEGKKTFIIVGAVILLGTLQGLDIYEISNSGWIILGALGLGSHRQAVKKIAADVAAIKK